MESALSNLYFATNNSAIRQMLDVVDEAKESPVLTFAEESAEENKEDPFPDIKIAHSRID
jgi:hypothetical protein